MKKTVRIISVVLVLMTFISLLCLTAQAAELSMVNTNYGYMLPLNSKGTKTVSTVKLYGTHDYINFSINAKKPETTFYYEVYSDKEYKNMVDGGYFYCEKRGEKTESVCVKLSGVYKSGTYYAITYAARFPSSDYAKVSKPSVKEFKISVDRNANFEEKTVILKNVYTTLDGPRVSWAEFTDAVKYHVYRRPVDGKKWTKVGTVNSPTRVITDKGVKEKSGEYIYTVKAENKKGVMSKYQYLGLLSVYVEAPELQSVSVIEDNKVRIKWKNISPEATYTIYRKRGDGGWSRIYKTEETTFEDSGLSNGKKHTYTIRANIPSKYGTGESKFYKNEDKSFVFLCAPKLTKATVEETGVGVFWDAVKGSKGYTVYRKLLDSDEKWTRLATVSNNETMYVDTTASTQEGAYVYTVRSEGEDKPGSFYSTGVEYVKLSSPDFKITTDSSGIHITWDEVPYAKGYQIFYKKSAGKWGLKYSTKKCSFDFHPSQYLNTALSVRSRRGQLHSVLNKDVENIVFYPEIHTSFEIYTDYTEISWNNTGAEEYRLYRRLKNDGESVYELIYSGQNTSYNDTEVKYDVQYEYQVRGIYEGVEQTEKLNDESIIRYDPEKYIDSFVAYREDPPRDEDGYHEYEYCFIRQTTETAQGKKQAVYGFEVGDEWVKLKDKDRESGDFWYAPPSPRFSLVVYDKYGSSPIDGAISTVSLEMCARPKIKFAVRKNDVKVFWDDVDGAKEYILSYSPYYEKIKVEANGSKNFSVVIDLSEFTERQVHYFTLWAVHENGNITIAAEDDVCFCTSVPTVLEVVPESDGNYIRWRPAENFDMDFHEYVVLRKTPGETSWEKIGVANNDRDYSDGGYYLDKKAKPNVKYKYTVRVYDSRFSSYMSYYDVSGLQVGKLATPTLVSAKNVSKGIKVSWEKNNSANGYYIYRKTDGTKWEKMAKVYWYEVENDCSYTDKTVSKGQTYYYTVKAFKGNYVSAYDKNGVMCKRK